jgi:hypothetical protein
MNLPRALRGDEFIPSEFTPTLEGRDASLRSRCHLARPNHNVVQYCRIIIRTNLGIRGFRAFNSSIPQFLNRRIGEFGCSLLLDEFTLRLRNATPYNSHSPIHLLTHSPALIAFGLHLQWNHSPLHSSLFTILIAFGLHLQWNPSPFSLQWRSLKIESGPSPIRKRSPRRHRGHRG